MSHRIRIGFEVFPPKSGSSETFESSVATLAAVGDYVSVIYGASGSGRERSETAINALVAQGHANKIAAHLTASSQSKDQIDRLARDWKAKGIRRIVALRGDAPAVTGDEYPCAAALTEALSQIGGFNIAVACYPEGHPKSASKAAEMDHLKRKFDAGAREAITQFFFNIEDYLAFISPSSRAFCLLPAWKGCIVSPPGVARKCQDGWTPVSRGWKTTQIPCEPCLLRPLYPCQIA